MASPLDFYLGERDRMTQLGQVGGKGIVDAYLLERKQKRDAIRDALQRQQMEQRARLADQQAQLARERLAETVATRRQRTKEWEAGAKKRGAEVGLIEAKTGSVKGKSRREKIKSAVAALGPGIKERLYAGATDDILAADMSAEIDRLAKVIPDASREELAGAIAGATEEAREEIAKEQKAELDREKIELDMLAKKEEVERKREGKAGGIIAVGDMRELNADRAAFDDLKAVLTMSNDPAIDWSNPAVGADEIGAVLGRAVDSFVDVGQIEEAYTRYRARLLEIEKTASPAKRAQATKQLQFLAQARKAMYAAAKSKNGPGVMTDADLQFWASVMFKPGQSQAQFQNAVASAVAETERALIWNVKAIDAKRGGVPPDLVEMADQGPQYRPYLTGLYNTGRGPVAGGSAGAFGGKATDTPKDIARRGAQATRGVIDSSGLSGLITSTLGLSEKEGPLLGESGPTTAKGAWHEKAFEAKQAHAAAEKRFNENPSDHNKALVGIAAANSQIARLTAEITDLQHKEDRLKAAGDTEGATQARREIEKKRELKRGAEARFKKSKREKPRKKVENPEDAYSETGIVPGLGGRKTSHREHKAETWAKLPESKSALETRVKNVKKRLAKEQARLKAGKKKHRRRRGFDIGMKEREIAAIKRELEAAENKLAGLDMPEGDDE